MQPNQLPSPEVLKKRWQSMAMLDAILSPEWEYRYFSFDAHWGDGEVLGSMRDGEGSAMRCLFTNAGAVLSGFDVKQKKHAQVLKAKDLPQTLAAFAAEPAFDNQHTSFCFFAKQGTPDWSTALQSVGSDAYNELLTLAGMDANAYVAWALEYHEAVVPVDAAARIFAAEPLTAEIVHAINAEAVLRDVRKEAKEIGYEVAIKSV